MRRVTDPMGENRAWDGMQYSLHDRGGLWIPLDIGFYDLSPSAIKNLRQIGLQEEGGLRDRSQSLWGSANYTDTLQDAHCRGHASPSGILYGMKGNFDSRDK